MSGVERFVVSDSESAGSESADEEATDETRSMSDGDGVDAIEGFTGVFEGFFDDRVDRLNVATSGDFWDDATVLGMDINLGHDNIR